MAFQPNLSNIILETCCLQSIKIINNKLENTKWLQRTIIPVVFASIFVSPTNPAGQGGAMTTIASIGQTDWAGLVRAAVAISEIPRHSIKHICFSESLKHPGKLGDFWKGLYESFI